ncbi:DUF4184 family protein [Brachybacterium sp. NBEC-018]|uniref:DUF4184 family protein n=1 Tax=Brachybacterium sp. NBEC-018 TaxID=2996004 RepID=UPI002174F1A6|nr:DUF4184 family protein [Brachybacterium sp. NBEC-018]UVY85368.1 DUF4184 family protein [Brachybacterium sp. NBEC-018]
MPFTPSHAIVALPFARRARVAAPLAVGAMAPDLPLFLRGIVPNAYPLTHDPRWIPATTLLALGLLLIWRGLLRPAARALAPPRVGERLPSSWDGSGDGAIRETFPSVRDGVLLLLLLAAGVGSHLLWDAFSHAHRAGTQWVPVLAAMWGPLPGYKIVQYASGVGGLVVLAVWGALRLSRQPVGPVRPAPGVIRWGCWLSLPLLMTGALVLGAAHSGVPGTGGEVYRLMGVLPTACGLWGLLVLALAIALRGRSKRFPQQVSDRSQKCG